MTSLFFTLVNWHWLIYPCFVLFSHFVFVVYMLTLRIMGSESLIMQRIFLKSSELSYFFLDRIRDLRLYKHKLSAQPRKHPCRKMGPFNTPHMCFIQNNTTYNSIPASFHLHGSSQAFSQLSVSDHSNAHKKTLSCSGILSAANGKRTRPVVLRHSSYQK